MPEELTPSSTEAMHRLKMAICRLETPEGRLSGLGVAVKPGDVFVVTPAKSGTTLLCGMVHSLRSGGDTSFDEINLVIPCLEMAVDSGYGDINAPQVAVPRVFKTHAWRPFCPRGPGARYVYCVRDPADAAPSFYDFGAGWFFKREEVDIDQFVTELIVRRGAPEHPMMNACHWHNIASWFPHRADTDVLWLHYEDVVAAPAAAVDAVADFLGLAVGDAAARALAVEHSSIEFMRAHPTKYDEHMLKEARNEACGLSPRAGLDGRSAGKVHVGGAGRGRARLSPGTLAEMDRKWAEVVAPATGYASYAEMRTGVNAELGRTWGQL